MDTVNYFQPDLEGALPFSARVEFLLGGIGRTMFPDGTYQFADQASDPVALFSPRLNEQALEDFCKQNIGRYEAHSEKHRALVLDLECPPIDHFWL